MTEPKTLKFPTCLGCDFYRPPSVLFAVESDWKCLNPHKGCYNRLKFFNSLVAAIEDRIKDLGDKYKAILVDG
ncbi:MAG: hypothetical protein E3J73_02790, partial [Candidatus Bathyarchaeum sp.]